MFSSLDLQSGYHHLRIADEAVPKTAFRRYKGFFEFRVLSFGLTNAPAVFQQEMNTVFADLPFVLVYLDDILAFRALACLMCYGKLNAMQALASLVDTCLCWRQG